MLAAIEDDPRCATENFAALAPSGRTEPQAGTFASTRHKALIRSILAKVVKSLPATRSITRRPRSASRRSPDAVIEPSGKASAAAISSRSGVSGLILSGGGIEAMAQQHM